jgi:hypothetical protein
MLGHIGCMVPWFFVGATLLASQACSAWLVYVLRCSCVTCVRRAALEGQLTCVQTMCASRLGCVLDILIGCPCQRGFIYHSQHPACRSTQAE